MPELDFALPKRRLHFFLIRQIRCHTDITDGPAAFIPLKGGRHIGGKLCAVRTLVTGFSAVVPMAKDLSVYGDDLVDILLISVKNGDVFPLEGLRGIAVHVRPGLINILDDTV